MAFYFVSQKDQDKENAQKILTAPDNKDYQYVKKTAVNDLVVQYNSASKSITGVARVVRDYRVSNGQIYIDVELYSFPKVLEKDLWVKELRACQGGKSPVNEKLGINSRYLQKLSPPGFRYLLKELGKYEENHSVCKMILDLAGPTEVLNDVGEGDDDSDGEILFVQKIFFGAPGTGKSFKVNQLVGDTENVFRTTFHPDYDYAQFVGSYKPKRNGTSITYSFVPQVFAKAYAAAWSKFIAADKKSTADNQVYLVIEEINRGNCAQIFGDIFQLLDRMDGRSEYPVDVDSDFADFIRAELAEKFNDYKKEICSYCEDAADESQTADDEFCKIALPPNFNILATMNTSDQSLFPMDSAFKRRFDWEYVPIDFEGKDCTDYQIEVGGEKPYPWQKFVESVNEKIVSITDSEDKQLGEYFIKLNPVDNNVITKERFLGKVMFYLWNEVCKDVHKQESFFREEENGNYFTFQDLYKKDGDKKLISFMDWINK